ncbi:hypothetical protein BDV12DRAFT_100594 [Aspergillus spectabilis]
MDHVKPERATRLIVFDNLNNDDILEDFWTREAAGSVLVTCRDPLIKSSIYLRNTGTIVPELSEEEGVSLLFRLISRKNEEDVQHAREVVRALGRYPLEIAQMAGAIVSRDLGFTESLELYSRKTERREIIGISEGHPLLSADTFRRLVQFGHSMAWMSAARPYQKLYHSSNQMASQNPF